MSPQLARNPSSIHPSEVLHGSPTRDPQLFSRLLCSLTTSVARGPSRTYSRAQTRGGPSRTYSRAQTRVGTSQPAWPVEPTDQAISLQSEIQLSTSFPSVYLRNEEPPFLWGSTCIADRREDPPGQRVKPRMKRNVPQDRQGCHLKGGFLRAAGGF